jgi:hypothetical protein
LVNFARFARFAKKSETLKTHDREVAFEGKARVPKWTPNAAWKAPKLHVERVSIDEDIDKDRLPPTKVVVLLGRARGERMDLFVVGAMWYLRELGPRPSQQVCDLIFLVGRGLPVIGASTWRAVRGDPTKLASAQVVFHKAVATQEIRPGRVAAGGRKKEVLFRYKGAFRMDNPEVMRALDKCAALPRSMWRVQCDNSTCTPMAAPPKNTELVEITSLASLGKWIIEARVLQKWGCRGFGVMSG